MDTANIIRTIGRRFAILLACILAGMAVAAFTQLRVSSDGLVPKAGRYRATVKVFVDMPYVDAEVAGQSVLRLLLTPSSHAEIVTTESFASEVSRRVGGTYSPQEIQRGLVAYGILPSQLLAIEITADSPKDAVKLADAAAATYSDWLKGRQDVANVPEKNRMTAEVITPPTEADVVSETATVNKWLTFGGIVGATIGLVIIFGMAPPEPRPRVVRLTSRLPGRRKSPPPAPPPTASPDHQIASDSGKEPANV